MILRIAQVLTILGLSTSVAVAESDFTLAGREAAALRLAIDDFTRHHYSASGDLSHYTLQVHRAAKRLEIDFVPDTDSRGPYPGGRTDYGLEMHYTVSFKQLRFLVHLPASDHAII